MLPRPLRAIWGNLSKEEIKKFGILAGIFFLIIGVYSMLKSIKDPIFDLHVGYSLQPWAKGASIFFIALSVLFYSKLVDLFKKNVVFYLMCGIYGVLMIVLSYFLANPHLATLSPDSFIYSIPGIGYLINQIPGSFLGWTTYLFVESFGSILPALFWAFVASTTTVSSARRGYAMIVTCTQVGNILGPSAVFKFRGQLGLPIFFAISGLLILVIALLVKWYVIAVPQEQAEEPISNGKKGGTGFFEGLRLLLTRPYLLGIFVVATFYEFIGTILDFQMGMLASAIYPSKLDGGAAFAWFKSIQNMSIGWISLAFAIFGTSFFMRVFGLRFCLVAFPATIGLTVLTIFASYYCGLSQLYLLWIFLASLVLIKAINYALNNPTKEVLYIPTSKDVKFKAKGWIDAFGARLLKGLSVPVSISLSDSLPVLLSVGTVMSLGFVGVWIVVAFSVSGAFDILQRDNKIVE